MQMTLPSACASVERSGDTSRAYTYACFSLAGCFRVALGTAGGWSSGVALGASHRVTPA